LINGSRASAGLLFVGRLAVMAKPLFGPEQLKDDVAVFYRFADS
jgi:hypothetical protein